MRKEKGVKIVETRNALITIERDGIQTLVIYSKKPARDDPAQLKLF